MWIINGIKKLSKASNCYTYPHAEWGQRNSPGLPSLSLKAEIWRTANSGQVLKKRERFSTTKEQLLWSFENSPLPWIPSLTTQVYRRKFRPPGWLTEPLNSTSPQPAFSQSLPHSHTSNQLFSPPAPKHGISRLWSRPEASSSPLTTRTLVIRSQNSSSKTKPAFSMVPSHFVLKRGEETRLTPSNNHLSQVLLSPL